MATPELRIKIPPLKNFSATELSAAEQLVQLSESSAESSAAATEESCSLSTSNTPVSSSKPKLFSIMEFGDDDEEDMGFGRKNRRYRSVRDLYEATARIDGQPNKKKK
ncbi:uncharacterized protein A4U43_C07F24640 [Asparagus officinalis]|uniref:Uncharacterized protein n=1 Tax=Asparagus officinalis TaxID=4686 RepID=A0A5P1EEM3_ASPOF|nr:uncharacterized protein A4U43_C07F24640 [Asparagus officinalis]